MVVFFDLDLFAPTLICWNLVSPLLKSGDILYFDEAFDPEEAAIIRHSVQMQFDLCVVGATHLAIGFQVQKRKQTISE